MKTFYAIIALILSTGVMHAQSPIVVDQDDMPQEEQIFLMTTVTPLIEFDATETGADYNWDYSDLEPASQDTSHWVADDETDPIYFFLWFTSDIAETGASVFNNDFITIDDLYNFYWSDNDYFGFSGFAGKISDIPFPIWFSDPEMIIEFPANYGQTTSSEVDFSFDIPDLGGWSEYRERSNEIDGWGTVTTPTSSYDVLRLASEILITDTFSYDFISIPVQYTTKEYRWIAKEEGVPVLQINMQEILGIETVSAITYKSAELTPVFNHNAPGSTAIHISGPAQEILHAVIDIQSDDTYTFILHDINGKKLMESSAFVAQGQYQYTQSVQQLAAGTYVLQVVQSGVTVASSTCIIQ